MEANEMQEILRDVMDEAQMEGSFPELDKISTYSESGVLTMNAGMVITMRDGSEFQITIVQSA